jgi:hypothetical protein
LYREARKILRREVSDRSHRESISWWDAGNKLMRDLLRHGCTQRLGLTRKDHRCPLAHASPTLLGSPPLVLADTAILSTLDATAAHDSDIGGTVSVSGAS